MFSVPEKYRLKSGMLKSDASYGNNGMFIIPHGSDEFTVVASDGEGWEHVSVSLPGKSPTWEEMCNIKNIFWGDEDCVIQFHPPKNEYVNNHPYCLHLWKPVGKEIEIPPSILTGIK